MNPSLISYYLDKRMKELGYCNGYAMRNKHFIIQPESTFTIEAWNEVYIIISEICDMRIESDLGVYDTGTENITNEQQHEHTGLISITNLTSDSKGHIQFVQAIPLDETNDCNECND